VEPQYPSQFDLAPVEEAPQKTSFRIWRIFWQGKIGPAFWNIASLLSLTVNIVLLVILVLVGRELFALKALVSDQLVSGLHENFVKMDQARITTTIQVDDTIPVTFDLPVQTETTVVLTKDTRIKNAIVNLSTGGLSITRAPANILLPAGTKLPIALNIVVPVNTTVPVSLKVPVDIPLNQTELHEPFIGLQKVVLPYDQLLASSPNTWSDTPVCRGDLDFVCNWLTGK
jgi:hypothetical protein